MKSAITAVALSLMLPNIAEAQSLHDGLEKGLSGLKKGVEKVGEGAANVADSIGDTVESTADLARKEATPEETRAKLDAMAAETLDRLLTEKPEAQALFEASEGHAVFDTRKVTLIGFTGGAGRGVAISPSGDRTYMNMGTAGVGFAFGLGGFETQVVILFEEAARFENFVVNGYDATAEAGTMFGEEKGGGDIHFVDGRVVFVLTKKGWRVSATFAGTRYWADASLN